MRLLNYKKYSPTKFEYIDEKYKLSHIVKRFYNGREMIVEAVKNKIFPLYCKKRFEDNDGDKNVRDENGLIDYKKVNRLISLKKKEIKIRKHFQVQNLSTVFKKLLKLKGKKKKTIFN